MSSQIRWLLFLSVLCATISPATAQQSHLQTTAASSTIEKQRYGQVSDDDMVIVEVKLAGHVLDDVVMGYYRDDYLLFPLKELISRLQFPIEVNVLTGTAQGWFIKESRPFALSIKDELAKSGATVHRFTPKQVVWETDDIYVDTRLLSQWFPVNMTFNHRRQVVEMQSRELLPVEAALMREKRTMAKGGEYKRPVYRRVEESYSLISPPSADVTFRTAYDSSSGRAWENDLSLLAANDAMYLNQITFGSFDEAGGIIDLRTRLERQDVDGALLGPLHAREISLGDVYSPPVDLVAKNTEGRGVFLTNFSNEYLAQSDRVVIRGDVQAGWDVELYRNDILLDFQRVGANGQYEFVDVPLLVGFNTFRLVFYGPFGERREETRRYVNDPAQRDKGKVYYRVAVTQHERDVIPVGNDDEFGTPDQGSERLSTEFSYGIADAVSLESNLVSLPLEDGSREHYASAGLRSAFWGMLADAQLTQAFNNEAQAGLVRLQTNLGTFNIVMEHNEFLDGFKSEQADSITDPFVRHSAARLDGALNIGLSRPIGFGLGGEYQEHESGRTVHILSNRLSTYIAGAYASHTLRYQRDEGVAGFTALDELEGDLLLSIRPWDRWTLRGEQIYDIKPEADLENTALTAEYMLYEDLNFRSGVVKNFENEGITSYSIGLNKYFKRLLAGMDSRYSDDGEVEVGLSVSLSLGRNPHTGEWLASYKEMASDGTVAPLVYLDHNQNSTFDAEDEPIEGAAFRVERMQQDETTDAQGSTLLQRIPLHQPVNVELDEKSLEDPYLLPLEKGKEVVAREGIPVAVEFPVVMTGEVDGTVYVKTPEDTKEASSVQLELLNEKGEIYARRTSSYDGFFLFEMIPLGTYYLRVSPEQLSRLGYKAILPLKIFLTRREQNSVGHIFTLESAPPPGPGELSAIEIRRRPAGW